MKNLDERTITQAVIERNSSSSNERLKDVMHSLVQHLHSFAREVQLTEEEWEIGVKFLTDVGQICSPTRQEFILLSDTLGLSTLVIAQNHKKPIGCTEATVFGPFHVQDAPHLELGSNMSEGVKGTSWFVNGVIKDIDGQIIPPMYKKKILIYIKDELFFMLTKMENTIFKRLFLKPIQFRMMVLSEKCLKH